MLALTAIDQDTETQLLACRAHMIMGGYYTSGDTAVDHLHKALETCTRVIAQNHYHLIGRMTYALAVGFEAKRLSKPGFARISRQHLEWLSETYPDNSLTQAALGGWHSEVSAAGLLARLALGASAKKAAQYFDAANSLGEMDIAMQLEYVKSIARRGKSSYQTALAEAESLTKRAPVTALDPVLLDHARTLKDALATGRKKTVRAALDAVAAFRGIESWKSRPKAPVLGP